jgi:hypothetical protein
MTNGQLKIAALSAADQADIKNPFAKKLPILALSTVSRSVLRSNYSAFLGYFSTEHPDRLALALEGRIDEPLVVDYATHRLQTYRGTTVKMMLDQLAVVLEALCPKIDWSWIKGSWEQRASGGNSQEAEAARDQR